MQASPRSRYLTVLILAVPLFLSAQQGIPKRVFVSAVDGGGRPVADLTAADFQITEDGVTRTEPSADREKLRTEIGRFASEGGANAFLETMIESDNRFLRTAPTQWPALVIVTTDNGDTRREPDLARYNRFMHDFLNRGGIAHAVVIAGKQTGPVTDLAQNLVQNTGGLYVSIVVDSGLTERLKHIAARLADDHHLMEDRYEVEFNGDAKLLQPTITVKAASRDDVRLQMSPRRPF